MVGHGSTAPKTFGAAIPLLVFLLTPLCAASPVTPPPPVWQPDLTIAGALAAHDGENVTCEGAVVERIAARNNPAYFVVRDPFVRSVKLVVLCRPPIALSREQFVDVSGIAGTLANGERCITNASVSLRVNEKGAPYCWQPAFWWRPEPGRQSLPNPTFPTPPCDPGLTDDGRGIPGPVTAHPIDQKWDGGNVSELLANPPLPLSQVVLECKPIVETAEGFIVVGDEDSQASVKVFTKSPAKPGDRVVKLTGSAHSEGGKLVLYADSGPAPYSDSQGELGYVQSVKRSAARGEVSVLSVPAAGAVAFARTFSNGNTVTVSGAVASAGGTDFPGAFYIQDPDRAAGIRVLYSGSLEIGRGDEVEVIGEIGLAGDGERKIDAGTSGVSYSDQLATPQPMGVPNRNLGGTQANQYTPGVPGAHGPYNKGLLVKSWGRVTAIDAEGKCFYVDDGSGLPAGSGETGIEVTWAWSPDTKPAIVPPDEGWYISVTGISGSEYRTIGQQEVLVRVLRPRTQEDIFVQDPPDTSDPTVAITSPSGTDWHIASGSDSILVSGTANDPDTPIAKVELRIDSGEWQAADYRPATGIWSWSWQDPESATVTARAVDSAGNDAETHVDVTLVEVTVIYVKPTGNNDNDGTSWAESKKTLSGDYGAMSLATSGDELWVAAGAYAEGATVTVPAGVGLYGGFTATETVREQRNWRLNLSMVRLTGVMMNVSPVSGDPAVVDGFAIDKGEITRASPGADVTIRHNTITDSDYGLVVTGTSACDIRIEDNLFQHCRIAGVRCQNTYASGISISNNTLTDNEAAISLDHSSPTIANSIIAFNDIGVIGDGLNTSNPVIRHSCLHNNNQDYYNIPQPGTANDNVYSDPELVDRESGDPHIQSISPCINAGSNDDVQDGETDIDGQERIHDDDVDIGADESRGGTWYTHGIAADPRWPLVDETCEVTYTTHDPVLDEPVAGHRVNISVRGATLLSIAPDGVLVGSSDGYAYTDTLGEVVVSVVRDTAGSAKVAASSCRSSEGEEYATETIRIQWYSPEAFGNWPMFMHDPQHSGMSPYPDTVAEAFGEPVWVASVPTASTSRTTQWSNHNNPGQSEGAYIFEHPFIDSSPVVMGDRVVVGTWTSITDYFGATGSVVAFNAETGEYNQQPGTPVWRYPANTQQYIGGVASTPCIYDDKVYVGSTDGKLYCLDLDTGAYQWEAQTYDRSSPLLPSKIIASPVVHDGIVYIGNEAAKIYAYEADDGDPVDGYPVVLPIEDHGVTVMDTKNMTGVSSPAISTVGESTYLLFGCDDGYLYRITLGVESPANTLDQVNLGYCVESSPTVVDDEVFVGVTRDFSDEVFRLSVEPFEVVGQAMMGPFGEECRATLAYDGNAYLYGGVDTGYTFHKVFQSSLWEAARPYQLAQGLGYYFVGSSALCQNGLAYVGNDDGVLRALSMVDLTQSAYYDPGEGSLICSTPAIAHNVDSSHNRWVYVLSRIDGGKLLAFTPGE